MNNASTKVTIKRATKTSMPAEVEIPDIETQVVPIHIVGLSPLLVNKFSEKSKGQIAGDAIGGVTDKKNRAPRNPDEEYEGSRILDAQGRDCFPARYIKAAIVTASTLAGLHKTIVRSTVFVIGDELIPIQGVDGKTLAKPEMARDWVRVGRFGAKQPMERYRAKYPTWSLRFRVQYEPRVVSPQRLIHLIRRAGLNVGLGEWRVEKNGEMGRFDIKLASVGK